MNRLIPFLTLLERELMRFLRLSSQTIAPPIITTVMFVLIFGYSLGSRIQEVSGFSYIHYIIPGLAGMGLINSAFANCSFSLFMARAYDRSIEGILSSPLSSMQIVTAYIISSVIRGTLVGIITLAVAAIFTSMSIASVGWTIFFVVMSSACFGGAGLIAGLWAEEWDHLGTITNFVLTPLTYLSGVFYSIKMLPPFWQKASLLNPLFYMIDCLRWAVLGSSDIPVWQSGSVVVISAIIFYLIPLYLFRRGWKLVV